MISMELHKTDSIFFGYYYYDKIGSPLSISGKMKDASTIELTEFNLNGENSGTFTGKLSGKVFKGQWSNAAKTKSFNFILEEDYTNSVSFEPFSKSELKYIDKKTDNPYCEFYLFYLNPKFYGKNESVKQLAEFMEDSVFKTVEGDFKTKTETNWKNFYSDYKDVAKDYDGKEDSNFYTWMNKTHIAVIYNNEGVLTIEHSNYTFQGGAHGLGTTTFLVYDMLQHEQIELDDIFIENYGEELTKIITQQMVGSGNTDVSFDVENINATPNFYITNGGIGFYYNPYEIAAYAFGPQQTFVTFKKLKHLLKVESPIKQFIK